MNQQEDYTSTNHTLLSLISKALTIVQNPLSDCTDEEIDVLMNIIAQTHVFQKNLDSQISIEDFLQRIKYFITYETYPKGTFLFQEGQYATKVAVILKGKAARFNQKTLEEIQFEELRRNPGFSLQKMDIDNAQEDAGSARQSPVNPGPKHNYLKSTTLASRMKVKTKPNKKHLKTLTSSKKHGISNDDEEEEDVGSRPDESIGELPLDDDDAEEEDAAPEENYKSLRSMNLSPTNIERDNSKKLSKLKTLRRYETITMDLMSTIDLEYELDDTAVENDTNLFKLICEQTPQLLTKYFIGEIFKLKRVKELRVGNLFGEDFLKNNKRKENLLVASEDIQLLTITKENYSKVMNLLYDEVSEKIKFFCTIFPSINELALTQFAYYFKEKVLKKGEKVYSEDEPTTSMYLLRYGDVQLFKTVEGLAQYGKGPSSDTLLVGSSRTAKPLTLPVASLVEGQFFGEELLLRETKRSYTATSKASNTKVYYLEGWLYQKIKANFFEVFKILRVQAREKRNWRQTRIEELVTNHINGAFENSGSLSLKKHASSDTSKKRAQTLLIGNPALPKPSKQINANGLEYYQINVRPGAGEEDFSFAESGRISPEDFNKQRAQSISEDIVADNSASRNLGVYKEKFSRKTYADNTAVNETLRKKAEPSNKSKAEASIASITSKVLDPVLSPVKRSDRSYLSISVNPNHLPLLSKRGSPIHMFKDDEIIKQDEGLPMIDSKSPILSQPSARNIKVMKSNVLKFLTPGLKPEGKEDVMSKAEVVKNLDGSLTVVTGRSKLRAILSSFEYSPNLYDAYKSVSPKKPEKMQLNAIQSAVKAENSILKHKQKKRINAVREHVNLPVDKFVKERQDALNSLISAQKLSLLKQKV